MGDKDSTSFRFGDRRHADRGETKGTARPVPSQVRPGNRDCGGIEHDVDAPDEEQFAERVRAALRRDPRIPEEGIHVAVEAGRVTLTGSVTSASAKRAAAEVVEALPGVRGVIDQMQVRA